MRELTSLLQKTCILGTAKGNKKDCGHLRLKDSVRCPEKAP